MDDNTDIIRRIAFLEAELAKPETQENVWPRTILYSEQLAELRDLLARWRDDQR